MPAKSDLTPRDLKDFLTDMVVFQRVAQKPSVYIVRLVGSKVATVIGHITGKTFEESAPAEAAARWSECCDLVLEGGQPLRFLGRVHIQGSEYLNADNLFVPLADDEGKPAFMMGLCLYTPRLTEKEESWENMIAAIGPGPQ